MLVAVCNRQRSFLFDPESAVKLVQEVVSLENYSCHEVGIHFIGTRAMRNLHDEFFQDSSLTDCISFPQDKVCSDYIALGDVFICPQVAITFARKIGEDPYRETTLYIVHGLLHLMGYDDIKERDRKEMRVAESKHLTNLQNKGLLLQRN